MYLYTVLAFGCISPLWVAAKYSSFDCTDFHLLIGLLNVFLGKAILSLRKTTVLVKGLQWAMFWVIAIDTNQHGLLFLSLEPSDTLLRGAR